MFPTPGQAPSTLLKATLGEPPESWSNELPQTMELSTKTKGVPPIVFNVSIRIPPPDCDAWFSLTVEFLRNSEEPMV